MQKTKIGISVGLLGALVYFLGLSSGAVAMLLVAGYVLLVEENEWLKKACVKAVVLAAVFSVARYTLRLIPNALDLVEDAIGLIPLLHIYINFSFIPSIISFVCDIISFVENALFILLGLTALNQGTVYVPIIDDIIKKHISE